MGKNVQRRRMMKMDSEAERIVGLTVDSKRREALCLDEVRAVLKKYNCVINPTVVISPKGLIVNWLVEALMVIIPASGGPLGSGGN
jgi:hypothetical protein